METVESRPLNRKSVMLLRVVKIHSQSRQINLHSKRKLRTISSPSSNINCRIRIHLQIHLRSHLQAQRQRQELISRLAKRILTLWMWTWTWMLTWTWMWTIQIQLQTRHQWPKLYPSKVQSKPRPPSTKNSEATSQNRLLSYNKWAPARQITSNVSFLVFALSDFVNEVCLCYHLVARFKGAIN